MHAALNHNLFLVKEHVGLFKAASNFDIYDPESGRQVLQCREEKLGFFTKLLRFSDYKRMTPFNIQIRDVDGSSVLRIPAVLSFLRSVVSVFDEHDARIGGFKQKLFSVGGAFDVLDANNQPICTLKGKWTGWEFRFAHQDLEFARVSKKWTGIGKELFTSADNYVLQITDATPPGHPLRQLILAAVMCIDMVLKE